MPNPDALESVGSPNVRRPSLIGLLPFGLAGGLIAFIITFLLKPVYRAEAVILLPASSSKLSPAVAQLGISLPGDSSSIQMFKAILESNSALEYVAKAVGRPAIEVKDVLSLDEDTRANTITIAAADRTPEAAIHLLNLRMEALKKINGRIVLPSKNGDVTKIQKSIDDVQSQLDKTEQNMLRFNEQSATAPVIGPGGVIEPAPYKQRLQDAMVDLEKAQRQRDYLRNLALRQATAAGVLPVNLPSSAKWQDRLADIEYELAIAKRHYLANSPEVVRLMEKKSGVEQAMRQDMKTYLSSAKQGFLDSSDLVDVESDLVADKAVLSSVERLEDQAPRDAIKLQQFQRKITILTQSLQQLTTLVHQAELDQSSDPNRWEVLDEPHVDPHPVNKRFPRFTAFGVAFGFIIGALWIYRKPKPV